MEGPKPGVQALKRYLRFARDGIIDTPEVTGLPEESPFEEEVTSALRDHGYSVDPQVGTQGYRIDIGVIDPQRPGSYILGVECDGATYHQARSARDRDKLRQRVLEDRGWKLHRIWSHDWWQDREGEIRRLVAAIESARVQGGSSGAEDCSETGPGVVIEETRRGGRPTIATRPYTFTQQPLTVSDENQLGAYMIEVVKAEGPITEQLLLNRMRDAIGVRRAGSNIRPWLLDIIAKNKARVKCIGNELYWSEDQLRVPRDWATRPPTEKKAELVPECELAVAARLVVSSAFGVSEQQACKAAFNLIGFPRVSKIAEARASGVLAKMIAANGLVKGQDGLLHIPK